MADPHVSGDHYQHGTQEISEQVSTFHLVMLMTKWGSLGVVSVILFTLLILASGFFTAFVSSLALLIVGIVLLREKKKAH